MSRPDLTEAEQKELQEVIWDFVEARAFDGVGCIVIVMGRGMRTTAYAQQVRHLVSDMLDISKKDHEHHLAEKAKQAN